MYCDGGHMGQTCYFYADCNGSDGCGYVTISYCINEGQDLVCDTIGETLTTCIRNFCSGEAKVRK
jgi:hypothetical protein